MAYAASRYTEAKLMPICQELFGDIDKDTVDFVPNYDNTTTEPTLLPATYPSILVNANVGIGVSMASSVCPFKSPILYMVKSSFRCEGLKPSISGNALDTKTLMAYGI